MIRLGANLVMALLTVSWFLASLISSGFVWRMTINFIFFYQTTVFICILVRLE